MKRLLTGPCHDDNVFHLVDPLAFLEVDFEAEVVKAACCLLPDYWCGVFAGGFVLEHERRVADLALVHKSLSHWFVVEVELASHSLDQHVLPQLRCFRYGEPDSSCGTSLQRAFGFLSREQVAALLTYIPRYVAVIVNMAVPDWAAALRALDVQHLTVSVFRDRSGRSAHELDGILVARTESIGFGRYSAIDNCLRIHTSCGIALGTVQILDQFGNSTSWTVREGSGSYWISKDRGPALLDHGCYVQIVRTLDGRLSLRPSRASETI